MTSPAVDPMRRLTPVVRLAPAKVNLTLAVLGTRADGFHDLHSVFAPLAFADRLSLAVAADGTTNSLFVDGTIPGDPAQNLVLRGIAAARRVVGGGWPGGGTGAGPGGPPKKRIPIAAGLGGGSSDGAAAVLGAFEAWGAKVDDDARRRALAMVGSTCRSS